MKHCRRCDSILPREAFGLNRRAADQLQSYCRPCMSQLVQATRDPEKHRVYQARYRAGHREQYRLYAATYRQAHRDQHRINQAAYYQRNRAAVQQRNRERQRRIRAAVNSRGGENDGS